MNKLCCFLTGGHRYDPSKVLSCSGTMDRVILLRNFCVKCGKMITFEFAQELIDKDLEEYRRRIRFGK